MSIPQRLGDFFQQHRAPYHVSWHKEAHTTLAAARAAHLEPHRMVKGVVLQAEDRLVMVVLPVDRSVDLRAVSETIHRHVALAESVQFEHLFPDCVPGSIPPLGPAYGLVTLLDRSLLRAGTVFFEAGDREEIIHVNGDVFRSLLAGVTIGDFAADVAE